MAARSRKPGRGQRMPVDAGPVVAGRSSSATSPPPCSSPGCRPAPASTPWPRLLSSAASCCARARHALVHLLRPPRHRPLPPTTRPPKRTATPSSSTPAFCPSRSTCRTPSTPAEARVTRSAMRPSPTSALRTSRRSPLRHPQLRRRRHPETCPAAPTPHLTRISGSIGRRSGAANQETPPARPCRR